MMEDTKNAYTGEGYIIVKASTARGAIPLSNVNVRVRNYNNADLTDKEGDVIAQFVTDRSGLTPKIALPAPSRSNSLSPGGNLPFSTYSIDIFSEGFAPQYYQNIPVFDGITAIQPADLIPLPETGTPGINAYGINQFFEGENPNL